MSNGILYFSIRIMKDEQRKVHHMMMLIERWMYNLIWIFPCTKILPWQNDMINSSALSSPLHNFLSTRQKNPPFAPTFFPNSTFTWRKTPFHNFHLFCQHFKLFILYNSLPHQTTSAQPAVAYAMVPSDLQNHPYLLIAQRPLHSLVRRASSTNRQSDWNKREKICQRTNPN